MRKVILAAALAATFCLPLRSQAQAAGGGGAAQTGNAAAPANSQATGVGEGAAPGGPPTAGSYSVQGQSQGTLGGNPQPSGVTGLGQPPMTTPGQSLGNAVGAPQTLYGPAAPSNANTGTGGAGTAGTATGAGNATQGTGNATQGAGTGGGGVGSAAQGGGTAGCACAPGTTGTASAGPATAGPVSEDVRVEVSRLASEVDQLRTEVDNLKAGRGQTAQQGVGTGGSGSGGIVASEPQPIASATLRGRVSKVSKRSVEVIDRETGEPYVLRVTQHTRARRGSRRIPISRIRKGSEVRASFDLSAGDTYATRIDVLPQRSAPARPQPRQKPQKQQQQQQQQQNCR